MRRLRIQDPDLVFHISNRTQEAKYLFRPDADFNALVRFWLRQAVRIHGIHLYAAVIMGNHFHLIARAPQMNMSKFMQYFQRNLSMSVNKLRKRYDATTFPRRFAAEPILDDADFERVLAYVLCNPVAANLVETCAQYPGLTTFRQSVGIPEEEPMPLTVPPMWKGLSASQVQQRFLAIVRPVVAEHASKRKRAVIGARRLRTMDWWRRPKRPKRGRRAFCHGSTRLARQHYTNFANRTEKRYRTAVLALREGQPAEFPYGTQPPGWTHCSCESPHRRVPRYLRLAA